MSREAIRFLGIKLALRIRGRTRSNSRDIIKNKSYQWYQMLIKLQGYICENYEVNSVYFDRMMWQKTEDPRIVTSYLGSLVRDGIDRTHKDVARIIEDFSALVWTWMANPVEKRIKHNVFARLRLSLYFRAALRRTHMRFPFAVVIVLLATSPSIGQQVDPYSSILQSPTEIQRSDNDDRLTLLLKESYNATHTEIRTRYNYWLQGVGEISGLLDSIKRFHSIRLELEAKADKRKFVEQKLAFAKTIEAQTAKGKSKARYEAIREIEECSARAFRIATELGLEELRKSDPKAN